MKRFLLIISLLFSFSVLAQDDSDIPSRPSPARLVNDFTHSLTPAQVEALEHKVVAYNDSTSTQIAIVLIKTLGDYDIADYALRLGRKWGVGGKEFSNGIIILAAMEDHKSRIEVGYGLEGAIPDITAKSILDNEITPNFRANNYYRGLDEAVDAIIRAAAGEYKAPAQAKKGKGPKISTIAVILVILFLIFGGGATAGGAGTFVSRRGSRGYSGGGFFPWIGSGGGWSGGGGGGGGGFGGFGGGSFGGGGASGSW
jgi:uncharacterized protein